MWSAFTQNKISDFSVFDSLKKVFQYRKFSKSKSMVEIKCREKLLKKFHLACWALIHWNSFALRNKIFSLISYTGRKVLHFLVILHLLWIFSRAWSTQSNIHQLVDLLLYIIDSSTKDLLALCILCKIFQLNITSLLCYQSLWNIHSLSLI